MLVLAIDSAMNGCSACVYETHSDADCAGTVLAQEQLEIRRGQAEHLMPIIQSVMEESNTEYKNLDLIGVTNGPGAFTGMRIGIATAKAIGLAAKKPVIGVSTFLAVLETYLSQKDIQREATSYDYYALILETKRKDYYFQMFDCNEEQSIQAEIEGMKIHAPAQVASGSEIETIIGKTNSLLIGDATDRLMREHKLPLQNHVIIIPEICSVAKLAVFHDRKQGGEYGCKPVYLRGAEIGVSKNIPRLIKQCRG